LLGQRFKDKNVRGTTLALFYRSHHLRSMVGEPIGFVSEVMRRFIWVFMVLLLPQMAWGSRANITKVDAKKVVIDIGSSRGVVVGMKADVLTNAGEVLHPVTGESYGNRRVKIGELEVTKVDIESAEARIVVAYGPINEGDIADGLVVIPSEQERMQMDIDEARSEIKSLARSLADEIKSNQKSIEDLRRALQRVGSSEQRLQTVMNAVLNMRERMVVFENRIATMEQQQQLMIAQDSSEVSVRDQIVGMEERIKMLEEQQTELEAMSMKMVAPMDSTQKPQTNADMMVGEGDLGALFPEEEEEPSEPWYLTWWFLAIIFALIGIVVGAVILMLKKKQGESASGGDALDDEMALDDEGFEEVETDDLIEDLPEDLPELETADDET